MPEDYPEIVDFKEFDNWLKSEGAIINKVKPRWENPCNRYLAATQDINVGEDLVKIPNTTWLTTYHVCDQESSPLCH